MQYMTFREPVGVVAAVLPYKGPVMTFAMKIAPALACGCTVVVKPSEYTNHRGDEARADRRGKRPDAGLVFNIVTGRR